jgi:acyl-CoA thioesterase-1
MLRHLLLSFAMMTVLTACSTGSPPGTAGVARSAGGAERASPIGRSSKAVAAHTDPVADARPVILAFGDSLTAGHGLELVNSYPSQLQKELDRLGHKYRVVNAGISGDTTSGGLSRIDAALEVRPQIVILELGANDGLRGVPVTESKHNLDVMIEKSKNAGATVLLAGMSLPLNYGPDYIHDFERMYGDLAKAQKVILIPFFLEGVAGRPDLNLEDGIHPTRKGYAVITQNLLRYLEPLLEK